MRTKPMKVAGVFNVDAVTLLWNQVELLSKKIDGLYGSTQVHPVMQCDTNGGGMNNPECRSYSLNTKNEQVNYMGNNSRPHNNPYSNTYNKSKTTATSKLSTTTVPKDHKVAYLATPKLTQESSFMRLLFEMKKGEVSNSEQKSVGKEYKPYVPYPNATKKDHTKKQFGKFLKLLKKLHINLPFIEALSQMPSSVKFLKELLANK
ncbi:receptor-like protein kinase FERONIA [Gossypium australe]|uniref:Receptor-like protein kinase FERONIA n=1 Tax=Gossypium australe TaxID=47621 RepID=A0A5B6X1C7_9ROSI|nr:receptor-like protein kinase FERONIA [Gossypium australe]